MIAEDPALSAGCIQSPVQARVFGTGPLTTSITAVGPKSPFCFVLASLAVLTYTLLATYARRRTQVLAPTDSAFLELRLDPSNINLANQTALEELLRYHMVDGEVGTNSMDDVGMLRTLNGGGSLSVVGGGTLIEDAEGGDASILVGNLPSSNGMVHAIDAVLMPFPETQLTGEMFPSGEAETSNDNVQVAALSAGIAAAVILVLAAVAVHKRRQADAAKPPQVAPDEDGWTGGGGNMRGAPIHPA